MNCTCLVCIALMYRIGGIERMGIGVERVSDLLLYIE